jgi:hypothetical protein
MKYRRPVRGSWLLASFLAAAAVAATSSAASGPSPTALERAEKLAATRMGVDRTGNLWVWNRRSRTLRVLSPAGELTHTVTVDLELPGEVSFDPEWGIAALEMDRELVVFNPSGAERTRRRLEHRAAHLAWIGPGRIAVAPKTAAHRVEIWDLGSGEPPRQWGREEPVPPGPGFHRVRAVLLAWDYARRRLWTLETFTGHLVVFSERGEVLDERTLPSERRTDLEDFFTTTDAEKKAAGEREETTLNSWPSLTLDAEGTAWLIEGLEPERGVARALRIAPGRDVEKREVETGPCASASAVIWGNHLVFYRHPAYPGRRCNETRRLPHLPPPVSLRLPDAGAAEAWVEITPLTSGGPARLLLWDGEPAEERTVAEPPAGRLMLCRGAAGRATTCATLFLHPGETLAVGFEPGAEVTGACFEGGEPVAGARVAVVPQGLATPRPFTMPLARDGRRLVRHTESGREGLFHLPEIGPGDYFLEVTFPSGRVHVSEPFTVPPPRPARPSGGGEPPVPVVDVGRIEIDPGLVVEFLVTDLAGRPIAEAQVGGGQGSGVSDWTVFEGRTGTEGRAVVSGFRPDLPLQLACRADGFEPATFRFDTPPGWLDCVLSPLVGVEGRVLDSDEQPLESVIVALMDDSGAARGLTDSEGLYRLSELTVGTHELSFAAPGFEAERLEVELSPEEGTHRLPPVVLRPAPPVRGQVRDDETEEPVAGARVRVLQPAGGGETATGPDGDFELAVGSPSGLRLRLTASGFAAREMEIPPQQLGDGEPLLLELSRGGWIRVRVWDEEAGGPCRGCTVWLRGDSSSGRLITGEDGEALTEPLAPGRYFVQSPGVRHRGTQATVTGGRDVRSATVRAGEVTHVELGEPVVIQRLELRPPPPPGWNLAAESPNRFDVYRPEADGTFRVRRRPGEPLALSLSGPPRVEGRASTLHIGALPPDPDPGAETLQLPDTALGGLVLRGGEAVAAARIELVSVAEQRPWATTFTSTAGFFELRHAPAGVYLLRIREQGVRTVSLAPGEHLELGRLELP